jgi:hypothetical protein
MRYRHTHWTAIGVAGRIRLACLVFAIVQQ